MVKFQDKFKKVDEFIKAQGIDAGFDNIYALIHLRMITESIFVESSLQEGIIAFIDTLINKGMDYEFEDEDEEYMKGYA